ncbi:sugar transferase [Erythrobacter sp. THAF29]|uniref:sugar transferase n=1 Tax=Erythrobacter sp. THAF29 TaxID=2587851 RepID=UPI0012A90C5D|nr:sugar transferase [Erythrobacter sp. THAF29]QFT77363.1 Undecaprenyl phosphate N,N'-diacetylbacillosamine 1-phosphate transferase [Erythrobacter sp. THAF29]
MHTTKHETVMRDGGATTGGPFFSSESTPSERELLAMASDLVRSSEEPVSDEASGLSRSLVRLMDLTLAIGLLGVLLPVILITGACIAMSSQGPVIFRQTRIGLGGREFQCWKFRSMRQDASERLAALLASCPDMRAEWERDQKLSDDPRITPLGTFLRSSSLDELPQLFNVIRGDMSLVGPRPIVHSEIPKYGRYITHYLSQKPGLTGLWQVSGRNNTSYRRRVAADVLYSRKASFRTDLAILFATIPAVLSAEGAR